MNEKEKAGMTKYVFMLTDLFPDYLKQIIINGSWIHNSLKRNHLTSVRSQNARFIGPNKHLFGWIFVWFT